MPTYQPKFSYFLAQGMNFCCLVGQKPDMQQHDTKSHNGQCCLPICVPNLVRFDLVCCSVT